MFEPRHHFPRAGTLVLALTTVFLVACSDDDPAGPGDDATGTVTGVVTAPNGVTPIAGATVTLQSAQGSVAFYTLDDVRFATTAAQEQGPSTTTEADGSFTLTGVPTGPQTLVATRGNFQGTIDVVVVENEVVELTEPVKAETILDMIYVPGSYDAIQEIAQDVLEVEQIFQVSASDLNDAATYDGVGFILLNCGSNWGQITEDGLELLRSFMEDGGIIYASDLTYPLVQSLFPDEIDSGSSGSSGMETADVVDTFLANWLDRDQVEINYDLGGWYRPEYESSVPVTLLVGAEESSYPGMSLVFTIQPSGFNGGLLFTSFHNTAQVTDDVVDLLSFFVLNAFE